MGFAARPVLRALSSRYRKLARLLLSRALPAPSCCCKECPFVLQRSERQRNYVFTDPQANRMKKVRQILMGVCASPHSHYLKATFYNSTQKFSAIDIRSKRRAHAHWIAKDWKKWISRSREKTRFLLLCSLLTLKQYLKTAMKSKSLLVWTASAATPLLFDYSFSLLLT